MKYFKSFFLIGLCLLVGIHPTHAHAPGKKGEQALVQLALLLDTSNSMDGLIAQAKSELWFVVNEITKLQKYGQEPRIEVALYEYGKASIPAEEQHLRQVVPFSGDLENLSEELFSLKTNGGQEYCGAVIRSAQNGLKWSSDEEDMKIIFIAGNESFAQGQIDHKKVCAQMAAREIFVNTIYCGDRSQGIQFLWNEGSAYGHGDYFNINKDAKAIYIVCPQDSEIEKIGALLDETYIPYGSRKSRDKRINQQISNNERALKLSYGSGVQRSITKGGSNYRNASWDLVDAVREGAVDLENIKKEHLPKLMKEMTYDEQLGYINEKQMQRDKLKKRMAILIEEREAHILKKKAETDFDEKNGRHTLKYVLSEENGRHTLKYVLSEAIKKMAKKKGFSSSI